ncbi:hypothetical protein LCGC14_2290580, partial [marine sediment metagenome]
MPKAQIDVGDVSPDSGFVGSPSKPIVVGKQKRKVQ